MIQFKRPLSKTDYKKLATSVAKAIADLSLGNAPGAANTAIDIIASAQGKAEQNAETQAWQWMYSVLAQASVEFLADPRLRSPLSAQELSSAITPFLETLPQSGEVAPEHLIHPAINAHFQAAIDLAPQIAAHAAPEHGLEVDALKTLFCRALSDAAGKVFARNTDGFRHLSDHLQSPMNVSQSREIAWQRHANWIRQRFTQDPIFSPDSTETIPLSHVYLRGRCYWHTEHDVPNSGDEEQRDPARAFTDRKKYRRAHLRDLHRTMHEWLQTAGTDDAIRIVAGGPGCGKSSFARAFATEVIDGNSHRVILIPLQYLSRKGNLDHDIGVYLHGQRSSRRVDTCMGFPENPLEWRGDDRLPMLLVFDGLDEMSTDDKTSKDISRHFLHALNNMLVRLNAGDAPPIGALVLGRSAACQEAMDDTNLGIETMLNVARITPLSRDDLELPDKETEGQPDLDAEPALMEQDDRQRYWECWRKVKRLGETDVPEAVTSADIRDLNAEPLLLHLLIISDYIGDNWKEAAENPNRVYRDILSKIAHRNMDKDGVPPEQREEKEADFFTLMECLGLAAWRGNGRTGTDKDFEELRDKHAGEDRFKGIDAAGLKNVALQIHTRQAVGDDAGFEFIHKSFGEYLSARALISAAIGLSEHMNIGRYAIGPLAAARNWAAIIGGAELTTFVLTFLKNEAKLTFKPTKALTVKTDLEKVLGAVQEYGVPVQELNREASYRELETLQRCAEGALLVTATAITAAAQDPDSEEKTHLRIPVPGQQDQEAQVRDDLTPRRYLTLRSLHRLHVTTRAPVLRGLALLDLSGAALITADLSEADLSEANLIEADLRGANLNGADLFGANLFGANLIEADLSGADLSGANLRGADLFEADLRGADLHGADLHGADLSEADLRGADLRGADLHGADLHGADLSGTDLRGANFRSAQIKSCDLKFVDLTKTLELTQEQVNSAKGSKASTKLPEGLEYPDHWDED